MLSDAKTIQTQVGVSIFAHAPLCLKTLVPWPLLYKCTYESVHVLYGLSENMQTYNEAVRNLLTRCG